MKFPWLEDAAIEAAAHQLLVDTFGPHASASAVDLDAIVFDNLSEREGLTFSNERDLGRHHGQQVLGRTQPVAGKIEITRALGSPDQVGRYRFTLAHELGHWRLHRPLFLAAVQQPDLFQRTDTEIELTSLHWGVFPSTADHAQPPEEWQANRFGIALLVHEGTLHEEFGLRFGPSPVARRSPGWRLSPNLREHARLLASGAAMGYPPLCDVFRLSTEAMAIVLESRGYATELPSML